MIHRHLRLLTPLSFALLLGALPTQAAIIADLRADYDAYTHEDGLSANIADTQGSGSWTFFARSTSSVAASSVDLVYTTTDNGVRNANAYAMSGQLLDLPGISNTQLISGGLEGAPAANQLALHPGWEGSTYSYIVLRWTPGAAEYGEATIAGDFIDLGVIGNGVTIQILDQFDTTFLNSASAGGNVPFEFTTTLASGSFIDFVIGNNGGFASDQAAMNVTITAIPEPTSATLLLGALSLCALRRRRA